MADTNADRVLIAETDEHGQVACVWFKRKAAKYARPIKDGAEFSRRIAEFQVFGAGQDDVLAWLDAHS